MRASSIYVIRLTRTRNAVFMSAGRSAERLPDETFTAQSSIFGCGLRQQVDCVLIAVDYAVAVFHLGVNRAQAAALR